MLKDEKKRMRSQECAKEKDSIVSISPFKMGYLVCPIQSLKILVSCEYSQLQFYDNIFNHHQYLERAD